MKSVHTLHRAKSSLFPEENFFLSPEVKILSSEDALSFKEIRLEALWYEGKFFASSYEEESLLPMTYWLQWCSSSEEQCAIGLFKGEKEIIGITTAMAWEEDPTGHTALFGKSYIRMGYRGQGLSPYLYKARLLWAEQNRRFFSAVVFHREGNYISETVNKKYGAEYWRTIPMKWGDGQTANGLWYRIPLKKNKEREEFPVASG